MKKLLALVSLVAFLAVSVSAQTTKPSTQTKAKTTSTEVVAKDAKAASGCCVKSNAACCKNNKEAKNCTAEQKANCAKASTKEANAKGTKEASKVEIKAEAVEGVDQAR